MQQIKISLKEETRQLKYQSEELINFLYKIKNE